MAARGHGLASWDLMSILGQDEHEDDTPVLTAPPGAIQRESLVADLLTRRFSDEGRPDAASAPRGHFGSVALQDLHRLFLEQRRELEGVLKAHLDDQSHLLYKHSVMPVIKEVPQTSDTEAKEQARDSISTATRLSVETMPPSLSPSSQTQQKKVQIQVAEDPERKSIGQAWAQVLPSCDEELAAQTQDSDNLYGESQTSRDQMTTVPTKATQSTTAPRKTKNSQRTAFEKSLLDLNDPLDDPEGDEDAARRRLSCSEAEVAETLNEFLHTQGGSQRCARLRRDVLVALHGKTFKAVLSFVILFNSVFIGVAVDHSLRLELNNPPGENEPHRFWSVMEWAFFTFFAGELFLRLWALRKEFFLGSEWRWNTFDALLVSQSALSIFLEQLNEESENLPNLYPARILRTLRFGRILRVIRVFKVFQSLRVMVISIVQSFLQLLWVFLLLLFVIYFFAIIFLHGVTDHIKNEANARRGKFFDETRELYGTLPNALVSLFMGICGGKDWSELLDPLMDIGGLYGVLFVFYIFFVVFGVLNVVTSIFVDSAQQVSKRDRDIVTQHELSQNKAYAKNIRNFFFEADKDGSGTLSWEEFENYLQDEKVQAYFGTLGLDVSQARALFLLLDTDESNSVGIEEFVWGCMKLKGDAKSIDVNMLLYETEKMIFQLSRFIEHAVFEFHVISEALGVPDGPQSPQSLPQSDQSEPRLSLNGSDPPIARVSTTPANTRRDKALQMLGMVSDVENIRSSLTGSVQLAVGDPGDSRPASKGSPMPATTWTSPKSCKPNGPASRETAAVDEVKIEDC